MHKNSTEIFGERKQKQQICLGTKHALLIRAQIAEISPHAQPYYRVMPNKEKQK